MLTVGTPQEARYSRRFGDNRPRISSVAASWIASWSDGIGKLYQLKNMLESAVKTAVVYPYIIMSDQRWKKKKVAVSGCASSMVVMQLIL